MKTVTQAVIAFEGVYPEKYDIGFIFCGTEISKTDFNACIDELSTNYGTCEVDYHKYKAFFTGVKTDRLLPIKQQENKVNIETCKLKWSECDEFIVCKDTDGDTRCWVVGSKYKITKSLNGSYVIDELKRRRFIGEYTGGLFTTEPPTKLIYTQELFDNNKLPDVDMLCKHQGVTKTVIAPLDVNNKMVLSSVDNGIYSLAHCNDIEPLTPPKTDTKKAIDDIENFLVKDRGVHTEESYNIAEGIFNLISDKDVHGVTFTGE